MSLFLPHRRPLALGRGDLTRYGAALAAASLIVGEAAGVALDFTSDTAVVRWPTQPASQYQGRLAKGLLTYTAPSPKMVYGPTGALRHQNHNLCPYSETLTDSGWSKNNLSVGAGNTLVEDTASTAKQIARGSIAVSAGLAYLCNVYVKIGAQSILRISLDSGTFGASGSTWYNLGTGAVGTNQGSTTPSIVAVPELGPGVYKCSYLRTATTTGNTAIYIAPAATDGGTTYLGTGATALTILGVELKRAPVHEDTGWAGYVPTGATAAALVPLDYDPSTLALRGVLVEEQRTNLHTYDEALSDASWTKMNLAVSDNVGTAPDGNATADKLVPSTSAGVEHIHRKTEAITTGSFVAESGFFKPDGYEVVRIRVLDADATGNGFTAAINLTTGATWSAVTGTGVISHILVERRADGWVRFGVAGRATTTATSVICDVFPVAGSNPAGTTYFTGDGTSGIRTYGRQCEQGASVGSYIPTGAAQVTRAADVITLPTSAIPLGSEHTLIAEGGPLASPAGATPILLSLDDGTTSNMAHIRRTDSTSSPAVQVITAGATEASLAITGAWPDGSARRIAFGARTNDVAFAAAAAISANDNNAALPAVTTLRIGSAPGGSSFLNGYIRRVAYVPRRLSNADLMARSA